MLKIYETLQEDYDKLNKICDWNFKFMTLPHANKSKRSAAENIVLLKHRYRLDALDIKRDDLIPFPDTSAKVKWYSSFPTLITSK